MSARDVVEAVVYLPADAAGATDPAQIPDGDDEYPMVAVVHGNSGSLLSYRGYDYLPDHLARNSGNAQNNLVCAPQTLASQVPEPCIRRLRARQ